MDGPINPRSYHNTPEGCNTCAEKWKKATDLQGSHCHFCGMSNCKHCLTKSRKFITKDTGRVELTKSGRQVIKRGTICKLCDRKFLIKDMVQGTLDEIRTHNSAISVALK